MKIHFYLRYSTQYGQALFLSLQDDPVYLPLEYLNDEYWHTSIEVDPKKTKSLQYRYHFRDKDGAEKTEWGNDRVLDLASSKADALQVSDYWNEAGAVENVFFAQPFQEIFFKQNEGKAPKSPAHFTHVFKVKAPVLKKDEVVCLLGHDIALRNWDAAAPILLHREGNWWTVRLDLSGQNFPLGYKYGVWNTATNKFIGFESGTNRTIYAPPGNIDAVVLHDGFLRGANPNWRGAGVAIPVFSLRTKDSFGVGEFTDMNRLTDWAKSVGLKLLQLLPINDTSATGAWTDSYPYAAVSAFALHPIFLNVGELAGKKHAAIIKPYSAKQRELNALDAVDYEAVIHTKWDIIRQLYPLMKADWQKDAAYQTYYQENKHWLLPYSAFCYLRDQNGTPDFSQWKSHQVFKQAEVEALLAPNAKTFDDVAIHLFVQWHLHVQMRAAVDYAHANGLALKGDIPIGIYRYSCDAWVAPELYNMDKQAGAPPDDFAEKGQNWGFPTYNWARMKEDGFAWWKQRFEQMKLYFDAFRIDHILGFFRIWSIPMDAVEGILGYFVPAIPVSEREFHDAGIGFNYDRLCKPYITDEVLYEYLGAHAQYSADHFLEHIPDGKRWSGASQYAVKPDYDTQRKVEAWFNSLTAPEAIESSAKKATKKPKLSEVVVPELSAQDADAIRTGMFNLLTNVILFRDPSGEGYHFRFGIDKISSMRHLPAEVQGKLNALYINYFFRRQDDFWKQEALEKLPELKRSTNMLICGEDLGMVPACVPSVMEELGILSLEIQRMPKKTGTAFFHPKDAPYLSVVTPSTHDMSTIRGWWEENRNLSQQFFTEILGYQGVAPFFCEPWLNQAILAQHFQSPALWAIFQIQDLLGMDGKLRRENPNDERINIPANPKHYWQYRMHINLEDLQAEKAFNDTLRGLVMESGRG